MHSQTGVWLYMMCEPIGRAGGRALFAAHALLCTMAGSMMYAVMPCYAMGLLRDQSLLYVELCVPQHIVLLCAAAGVCSSTW